MTAEVAPAGRPRRLPWRSALMLIAVLVLVRWQLLQPMLVPSDSMQPLLNGDPEHGDHVLVLKNAHRWREPARHELLVFQREVGGEVRYLVKRAVAFGGESVQVRGGDLFVGQDQGGGLPLLQKTFADLVRMRVLLWDEPMDDGFARRFEVREGAAERTATGWQFSGDGEGAERLDCRSLSVPRSGYLDEEGRKVEGSQVVSDLMLEVTLTPEAAAAGVAVQLREGMDQFHFHVAGPNAAEVGIQHLQASGEVVALKSPETTPASQVTGGFPPDVPVTVTVWNVDESVGVAVNGVEVISMTHAAVDQVALQLREGPSFGVFGGPATVQGVRLFRDLHYTSMDESGPGSWSVPSGHVFFLGDHSESSIDSRHFGPVPVADLVGRPIAVCWPPGRWRRLD